MIIQMFLSFSFYLILGFVLGVSTYMTFDSFLVWLTGKTLREYIFKEKPMTQNDRIKECENE